MPRTKLEAQQYLRRKLRTRAVLAEHADIPRLSVHRTLRAIYAQIIDDATGKTIAATSSAVLSAKGTKTEQAQAVGAKIAELAKEKSVSAVRFDRGARRYHGRIAALAEAARTAGLSF